MHKYITLSPTTHRGLTSRYYGWLADTTMAEKSADKYAFKSVQAWNLEIGKNPILITH